MAYEFRLPDVGEGVHEGEIVAWLVAEGDVVEEDQDIVEVMTDKATVQISSPVAGTIAKIHFQEGDVLNVGDVFVTIASGDGGEAAAGAGDDATAEAAPSQPPARAATQAPPAPGPAGPGGGRTPPGVLAPPSVRLEARRRGIELTAVKGSARGGRITMADLEAAPRPPPPPREAPTSGGPSAVAPHSPLNTFELPTVDRSRAAGAEPLAARAPSPRASAARAKALQAHFAYVLEVEADGLARAVENGRRAAEAAGVALDATAFVVKALAVALTGHPRCNGLVDEASADLVVPAKVNVGVAVPGEEGLVVRTVANAANRGLVDIARVVAEGPGDDVTPTVTLTALGALGGVVSTPVLVHPQVTAVALGAMRDVAREENGRFVPGQATTLSFTFDHRYIDGYDGAVMANEVARLLGSAGALLSEDPQ